MILIRRSPDKAPFDVVTGQATIRIDVWFWVPLVLLNQVQRSRMRGGCDLMVWIQSLLFSLLHDDGVKEVVLRRCF
ncbi:MAG: hypothetical protein D6820_18125 [Lentisphaerae bacterium]|nr:MAG: hypothetical protein D6820_18125 [Lentisphaerota bacterium]